MFAENVCQLMCFYNYSIQAQMACMYERYFPYVSLALYILTRTQIATNWEKQKKKIEEEEETERAGVNQNFYKEAEIK